MVLEAPTSAVVTSVARGPRRRTSVGRFRGSTRRSTGRLVSCTRSGPRLTKGPEIRDATVTWPSRRTCSLNVPAAPRGTNYCPRRSPRPWASFPLRRRTWPSAPRPTYSWKTSWPWRFRQFSWRRSCKTPAWTRLSSAPGAAGHSATLRRLWRSILRTSSTTYSLVDSTARCISPYRTAVRISPPSRRCFGRLGRASAWRSPGEP
mmetsp:Transcript_32352/g.89405  ORF Transcript_32352/g.89405 Transcript_32352/m.89405 type:complete len:205 (+) Transcript_32352:668-1282(+)